MTSRNILYPSIAFVAIAIAAPLNTGQAGAFQPHNPVVFAKPFLAAEQQFLTLPPQQVPLPEATWHGWQSHQLEYKFAKPVPAAVQQYTAFQPRGQINSISPQGFYPQQPDIFAKPFAVKEQQYTAWFKFPPSAQPNGWDTYQFNYAFKRQISITEQPYTTSPEPEQFLPGKGWHGWQLDAKFVKPFPVEQQQYVAVNDWGIIPPNLPPGGGKRYKKPTDYLPEPPYDVKPNKPFQPIWDKRRSDEAAAAAAEKAKASAPQAPQPVPLPPASIFGQPGNAPRPALNLPDFNNFAPQDPLGLAKRMNDAQDMSDAIALLKSLGLIRDEG